MSRASPRKIDRGKGGPVGASFLGKRAFGRGKCEALCASPGPVARDLWLIERIAGAHLVDVAGEPVGQRRVVDLEHVLGVPLA